SCLLVRVRQALPFVLRNYFGPYDGPDELRRSTEPDAFVSSGPAFYPSRRECGFIPNSDAPYHDLGHTICVTLVGQEVLRGKHLREGGVSPRDWLHFIISLSRCQLRMRARPRPSTQLCCVHPTLSASSPTPTTCARSLHCSPSSRKRG